MSALKKFGVKLVRYKGQDFGMWVYADVGRFETTDEREAYDRKSVSENHNPDGYYEVQEIP